MADTGSSSTTATRWLRPTARPIVVKALNLLSKGAGASAPVGDVTQVNEAKTAEEALTVLSKEARKALRETGLWHQEFHGNEIVSVIACFIAAKAELDKQNKDK